MCLVPVENPSEVSANDTLQAVMARNLNKRLYLPTDESNLSCLKCPRTFTRSHYLKRHLVLLHGMIMCKNCKIFYAKDENHSCEKSMNEATANCLVKCDICGHKASTDFGMVLHNIEFHGS